MHEIAYDTQTAESEAKALQHTLAETLLAQHLLKQEKAEVDDQAQAQVHGLTQEQLQELSSLGIALELEEQAHQQTVQAIAVSEQLTEKWQARLQPALARYSRLKELTETQFGHVLSQYVGARRRCNELTLQLEGVLVEQKNAAAVVRVAAVEAQRAVCEANALRSSDAARADQGVAERRAKQLTIRLQECTAPLTAVTTELQSLERALAAAKPQVELLLKELAQVRELYLSRVGRF